jgi:bidirectional [NiFe] hydrogenase diaphorase subunit
MTLGPKNNRTEPAARAGRDRRLQLLEVAMKRHHFRQSALIEALHAAQEIFGYLEFDLLYFIARQLKLPPSQVYGVATFYHFFALQPKGEHTCVICTGTACYVKGADALLAAVEHTAHVKAGETTPDNKLSLMTARCFGACGQAPAAVLDGTVRGHLSPATLLEHLKVWLTSGSERAARTC